MNFRSIQKVGFHIFFDLIQPLKHNTVHNMGDRQSKGRAAGEEILSNMNTVLPKWIILYLNGFCGGGVYLSCIKAVAVFFYTYQK